LEAPHETYSVIVLESQANMFQYWLGHRAMYDQFATASQIAQLDVEEILTIVATLRKQAGERYLRLTAPEKYQPPKPGTYKTERRKDI